MNNRDNIANELREANPLLAGMEKVNVYTVPNGYFEELAGKVLLQVNNENSRLLTGAGKPQAGVPEGYFDTLANTILNRIREQEAADLYPLLSSISRENVYAVPQGYFESLASNSLYNIKSRETAEAYPVLGHISKENVYSVPGAYFETLGRELLSKVRQPKAGVVGMGKRTGWMKYAAAAVFTGIIAVSAYKFTAKEPPAVTNLPGYYAAAEKITNVDAELAKVTDEDIIKYLQANGTDVDAAVVANVMDENELPAKEDYLTDDKALDKYLDNIDLTDLKN